MSPVGGPWDTGEPHVLTPASEMHPRTRMQTTEERELIIAKVVADYDRRMSTRWGRFLLWLLRKTT